ncbi:MAG: thioredoxin domain-containing protein [Candidatus Hodarchaeota archaeon]
MSSQNQSFKNELVKEKSPYLLQHANNPVNWFPWSEEAFNKAKDENKPIFLSIGYSTCHWCHVMAHESFEDEEIGNLMNEVFISIKVDREERPDIDKIYMTVCQMMTGSGGWPLTIIMTPDKNPFFAGTYFPKETRFGRIGLIDLIKKIKKIWNNNKSEIFNSSEQIKFALQNVTQESPGDKFNIEMLKRTYNQLTLQFDSKNGGFGERPKFPTPHNLLFLLRFWKRTGSKDALKIVEKTLQAIRKGGIYDQIGFGIHRYSTDSHWLVPHFEKMLYDQALVSIAYLEAYQATKNEFYANTAREIFTYVLRDMTSPEGGFYSAEDADSEGVEGKFYVWSKKEIEKSLSSKDAEFILKIFNIEDSGNYLEEATQDKTGNNILYIDSLEDSIIPKLEEIRKELFNIREKRIHPHKDDKILSDWNGLMIAALAIASRVLNEPKYLEAAKNAVKFILSVMKNSENRLLHSYREGKAEIDAYLTDYAFLIWGLIELYEATFNVFYLKSALELNKIQIDHFWDNIIGGFYFTADDSEKLLTRQKDIYDGAIPSGNSVAMLNLLRLSYITGDYTLEEKADILSRVFSEKLYNTPIAYTQFMVAADFAVGPSYSIVIAGDTGANDTNEIIEAIFNEYIPNKVLIHRRTDQNPPDIDEFANFVEYFDNLKGKATAYICINKMCKTPTSDVNIMLGFLNPKWKK